MKIFSGMMYIYIHIYVCVHNYICKSRYFLFTKFLVAELFEVVVDFNDQLHIEDFKYVPTYIFKARDCDWFRDTLKCICIDWTRADFLPCSRHHEVPKLTYYRCDCHFWTDILTGSAWKLKLGPSRSAHLLFV